MLTCCPFFLGNKSFKGLFSVANKKKQATLIIAKSKEKKTLNPRNLRNGVDEKAGKKSKDSNHPSSLNLKKSVVALVLKFLAKKKL